MLPSAHGADVRPMQSSLDQQIGPGYPNTAYSTSAGREQPTWHREGARAPVSTAHSGYPLTASEHSAAFSCPAGRSLQIGTGTPFATSEEDRHNRARLLGVGPRHGTAPVLAHAAGRQIRKSEAPPNALAAADPGRALQSLPEPKSQEASPPYATHAEHRSADFSSMHAQAQHILCDSPEDSHVKDGAQRLPGGDPRAARAAAGPVRDERESAGMSADGDRDSIGHLSSPRHSISSLRPYANDASLQVRASAPAHACITQMCLGVESALTTGMLLAERATYVWKGLAGVLFGLSRIRQLRGRNVPDLPSSYVEDAHAQGHLYMTS